MKSIVVAVDGSPHSLKGLREAAILAKALPARLELAYVLPPILLSPNVYAETIAKVEEGNRQHAEEILETAKKAALELGVEADAVVLTGAPSEALADLALNERVWGVVIGAKGHGAVARMLLGSITDRLVHICTKPVLVIR